MAYYLSIFSLRQMLETGQSSMTFMKCHGMRRLTRTTVGISPQSVQAENKSASSSGEKDYSNKKNYSRES